MIARPETGDTLVASQQYTNDREPYDDTELAEEAADEGGTGGVAVKPSSNERCSGRPIPASADRSDLRFVGLDISRPDPTLSKNYSGLVYVDTAPSPP